MNPSLPCPLRLYKYRSIKTEEDQRRASRIITEGRIYYAAPKDLNDPFDCRYCFNMDAVPTKLKEFKPEAEEHLWADVNEHFSILSLSADNKNIPMWSHYADYHEGICLELTFSTEQELYQVEYSHVRPQLLFADIYNRDENFSQRVINVLKTKAKKWEYEEEFRYVAPEPAGERQIPNGKVSGIIFGCRTSDKHQQMVRDWVKSAHLSVTLYKASPKSGPFELDVREFD